MGYLGGSLNWGPFRGPFYKGAVPMLGDLKLKRYYRTTCLKATTGGLNN